MEIIEEQVEKKELEEIKESKKRFTISSFTVWRLLAYFVIYSFLGYIIETIYGMITKGVLESRKSFLYGPFCAIYGVGAVIMVVSLRHFRKNNNQLFIGGFVVGSIIEYLVSLIGELIIHVRWWDYSNMPFNIQGRICLVYSIFWGVLAIYLMTRVNPKINKFINWFVSKISMAKLRIITVLSVILLILDCIVTIFALGMFFIRKVYENDLNVANKEIIDIEYEKIYGNPQSANFIEQFFNDKKMIKTFPNLKIQDLDGNIVFFKNMVGDIQPYYYKMKSNMKEEFSTIFKYVED